MKHVWRVLALLVALLLVATAVIVWRLFRSVPPLSGTESLPGLGAVVTVRFDSLGVPNIEAASDRDAFAALGYLHARDRLWQMETLRRAAEGRLSEIFGRATVESDRYLRSLDIPHAAARSLALLPTESRAIMEAYVAGINRWVTRPTRPLPPEFQVLRFRPEPWTAAQLYEVERLMAWDLAAASLELSLARAAAQVGPVRVRELFPQYPDSGPFILPAGVARWRRGALVRRPAGALRYVPSARLAADAVPAIPEPAARILDGVAMARASNSWVIGPRRSRSGKPILANDPHLMLRVPSLWYLAAIESPGFHVAGATIPGLPAVILGHNRRIAWGFTNIEADDVDYVIERLSRDSSRVLTRAGWVPVEAVRDSIRVRGARAAPFTLRRTSHGPLVPRPGVAGPPRGDTIEAVAMLWNAHDPSDELTAMLDVDRAGSWAELLAAVARFKVPEQNWVYADVDGNIGYTASGAIPVRRSGTGALPTPGWTDEGRWERYLDFDELPRALNPPDGFIVTANNRVAGREYPWMLSQNWGPPYRAARIRELILHGGPFTADDMRRMQMDTVDAFARWARNLAARAAEAAGRADLARALSEWDGTMGADRPEPLLFTIWYRVLQRLTFEDELDGYAPASPLHAWLGAGRSPWFDDTRTPEREDLAALSLRAMRVAMPMAQGRLWGDAHLTLARHALGSSRPLNLLLRLNFGPTPRAGSLYTVNVADFGNFAPPFVNTHAASLRHVVDMADPEAGMFIITTGQSGNPLSSRYRDQDPLWLRGRLWSVPLSAARVAAVGTLRLVPGER